MEVILGDDFIVESKKLTEKLKIKLAQLIELLRENYRNPQLHTKQLHGELFGFYSFRINRDYRVIFEIKNNLIRIITLGHRKDIYE